MNVLVSFARSPDHYISVKGWHVHRWQFEFRIRGGAFSGGSHKHNTSLQDIPPSTFRDTSYATYTYGSGLGDTTGCHNCRYPDHFASECVRIRESSFACNMHVTAGSHTQMIQKAHLTCIKAETIMKEC